MVKENIFKVRQSIAETCSKIGQDPDKVTIVAVSKGRTIREIKEAAGAGITDIAENKVQEALLKYNDILTTSEERRIKWHMVGHLQTNKVKEAVRIFDLIHSVDSLRLALEIDKQAGKINKVQGILIEVNVSGEAAKYGINPEELPALVKSVSGLKNLRLHGLMTIAPVALNAEEVRPYFRMLRELRDKINNLQLLSMGMSDDYEVAIEEGSNMVRIGRAIFEG